MDRRRATFSQTAAISVWPHRRRSLAVIRECHSFVFTVAPARIAGTLIGALVSWTGRGGDIEIGILEEGILLDDSAASPDL
jgi:hypothetical protein